MRQDGDAAAGLVLQRVFGSYTQAFNNKYGRRGTLFAGRFQVKAVDNESYLRHLCRYIHANPVKHGLALSPDLWPYSNFLEWIDKRNGTLVDRNFIRQWFPNRAAYEQSVIEFLARQRHLSPGLLDYLITIP